MQDENQDNVREEPREVGAWPDSMAGAPKEDAAAPSGEQNSGGVSHGASQPPGGYAPGISPEEVDPVHASLSTEGSNLPTLEELQAPTLQPQVVDLSQVPPEYLDPSSPAFQEDYYIAYLSMSGDQEMLHTYLDNKNAELEQEGELVDLYSQLSHQTGSPTLQSYYAGLVEGLVGESGASHPGTGPADFDDLDYGG